MSSYLGDIEIRSMSDGLVVVNEIPLETYLLGLAEVPGSWPTEALEAQAIAARTYALWTLALISFVDHGGRLYKIVGG